MMLSVKVLPQRSSLLFGGDSNSSTPIDYRKMLQTSSRSLKNEQANGSLSIDRFAYSPNTTDSITVPVEVKSSKLKSGLSQEEQAHLKFLLQKEEVREEEQKDSKKWTGIQIGLGLLGVGVGIVLLVFAPGAIPAIIAATGIGTPALISAVKGISTLLIDLANNKTAFPVFKAKIRKHILNFKKHIPVVRPKNSELLTLEERARLDLVHSWSKAIQDFDTAVTIEAEQTSDPVIHTLKAAKVFGKELIHSSRVYVAEFGNYKQNKEVTTTVAMIKEYKDSYKASIKNKDASLEGAHQNVELGKALVNQLRERIINPA